MPTLPATGLTEIEHRAVEAIAGARRAWIAASVLAWDGVEPDTLAGLEAAGWLARWDRAADGAEFAEGIFWTLSPLAAERLGLTIDDDPSEDRPHWVEAPRDEDGHLLPLDTPIRARTYPGEHRMTHPELVALAEAAEEPELLIDPYTDLPVTILGVPVEVDRRARKASITERKRTRRKTG